MVHYLLFRGVLRPFWAGLLLVAYLLHSASLFAEESEVSTVVPRSANWEYCLEDSTLRPFLKKERVGSINVYVYREHADAEQQGDEVEVRVPITLALVTDEGSHKILYQRRADEKVDVFYPLCPRESIRKHAPKTSKKKEGYPQLVIIAKTNEKRDFLSEVKGVKQAWLVEPSLSLPVGSQRARDLNQKVQEIIQGGRTKLGNLISPFLRDLDVPFKISARIEGIAAEDIELLVDAVKPVKFTLPEGFADEVRALGYKPEEKISLSQCLRPAAVGPEEFETSCRDGLTTTTVEIEGFEPFEKRPVGIGDFVITWSDLKFRVTVESPSVKYYMGQKTEQEVELFEVSEPLLSYEDWANGPLALSVVESLPENCTSETEFRLDQILSREEQKVRLPSCRQVILEWAVAWGNPRPLEGCEEIRRDNGKAHQVCWVGALDGESFQALDVRWDTVGWGCEVRAQGDERIDLAKQLRPGWPFIHTSASKEATNFDSGVESRNGEGTSMESYDSLKPTPRYQVEGVYYHLGQGDLGTLIELEGNRLPTLADVGWRPDMPLPRITLELTQMPPMKEGFREVAHIPWRLNQGQPDHLMEAFWQNLRDLRAGESRELPIRLPAQVSIPYEAGYRVLVFPDREACRQFPNEPGRQFGFYSQEELEGRSLLVGSYLRLVEDDLKSSISQCAEAVQEGGGVSFEFVAGPCWGRQKLIVVSLSPDLDSHGQILQQEILEGLQNMLADGAVVPFSLVSAGGQRLRSVLACDELLALEQEYDLSSGDELAGILSEQLRFGSRILPLKALDLVSAMFPVEKISQVLYFTDGPRNALRPEVFGIPLVWYNQGVPLTVWTTADCESWMNHGRAKCFALSEEDPVQEQVKILIHDFFDEDKQSEEVLEGTK